MRAICFAKAAAVVAKKESLCLAEDYTYFALVGFRHFATVSFIIVFSVNHDCG